MESRERKYIEEDRLSFKDVIDRIRYWFWFLLSKWKMILIGSVVIAGLYATYQLIRKPVYTAETTFVLESGSGGSMGGLSAIASVTGFNLGSLSQGNELFQSDNIMELYQSKRMLRETFLSRVKIEEEEELLIDRYATYADLHEEWNEEPHLKGINFDIPREELTIQHDSILFEVIKKFKEKNLVIDKPNRLLTIISVRINHKDELFAKAFNEALVQNVNEFYLETRSKKSAIELMILQKQTDSVKNVLDQQMAELARISEGRPNVNPLMRTEFLPAQQLQIDIQSSAAAYQELVKNLELAKISHRNSTPLIQIIDEPLLPLPDDKYKLFKLIVLSCFLGGFLMVAYFTVKLIMASALKE